MKAKIVMFIGILAMAFSLSVHASEFCDGFEMGYKTVKGNNVLVPLCPLAPLTPLGSTAYQEGIKAGIKKARTGW
jgi:hypothetical protein